MNTIGERIRFLRKRWNLSQAELARLLDVSSARVCSWEFNRSKLPADFVPILADRFNVTCDFILRGK